MQRNRIRFASGELMKSYGKVMAISLLGLILFFLSLLGCYWKQEENQNEMYHIEMNRIAMEWQKTGCLPRDLSAYHSIKAVKVISLEGSSSK